MWPYNHGRDVKRRNSRGIKWICGSHVTSSFFFYLSNFEQRTYILKTLCKHLNIFNFSPKNLKKHPPSKRKKKTSPGAAVSFGRPGEAVPSTGTVPVRAASCSASAAARAEAASAVTTADGATADVATAGAAASASQSEAESEAESESSTSSARGGGIRSERIKRVPVFYPGPVKWSEKWLQGTWKRTNRCFRMVIRLWSYSGCYAMGAKCSWRNISKQSTYSNSIVS